MNLLELPNTIIGWVGTISAVFLMGAFFVYQIRRNDLKLLRESIEDLTARVRFLEEENARFKVENSVLTKTLTTTKQKKDYLKSLFVQGVALQITMDKSLTAAVNDHLDKK